LTPALPSIAATPVLDDLLRQHAGVAIGVSGGKDSQVAAIATFDYLDRIGHGGPRLLIHADLGIVEWAVRSPCANASQSVSASSSLSFAANRAA
jgi:NH3-dependent NAD+ synthetase